MKQYPMVDLVGQYYKIKDEVDAAIQDVIASAAFINGPAVKAFQSDLEHYLNIKHVIPCGNGTDALQVALMALGLQPGDEVITTTFTFIATAEVIALLKLRPVLVDVCPNTFNIDPHAIEKAITSKTKAIIPVHLFGQCADMDRIMAIADTHNLFVIEDAAQALGATWYAKNGTAKKAGTIGHIGCTSFFPSKNLGCYGDGGAVFTNDDTLAEQLRMIVNHGMKIRYYHDIVGVNSRLDSIQAAILQIKLKYLDTYADARKQAANYYNTAFEGCDKLSTPITADFTDHVFHQYTLVTHQIDREALATYLKRNGIASAIYYPVPLHLQKAYLDPRYKDGDFPIAENLSETVFSLPIHTEMDEATLQYISQTVLSFLNT
ncbi:MAG: DegT/DnrJ/EryC1/StrS family aminotransferase [Bacteroidales bacterium]|jgi:dTDP-4-amino-4,6-dideoxygalactose transaminase|nr:DegT/DnrJ/EryC1/StrS family aminotransferase [Bacteroidales bacterium]MDD3702254.1 DegT/DnrJ/EryC1/StrS family aminotransferase [Bacteroidales bacterium]MDY0368871.1 DegT/DnrJ/EryC1/StrS family aminotransferase [Bacteroidales bacterium]